MPANVKNEFSAMPVMIPGSAIGSTSRTRRLAAEEAEAVHRERRHRAEHERDRGREQPALTRARARAHVWSCHATENHFVEARRSASSARSTG
jgi:hypothetical protein